MTEKQQQEPTPGLPPTDCSAISLAPEIEAGCRSILGDLNYSNMKDDLIGHATRGCPTDWLFGWCHGWVKRQEEYEEEMQDLAIERDLADY